MARDSDDPRLDERFLQYIPGNDPDLGDVTIVGVVHDHPASVCRAGAIVDSRDPTVVALELPPMAVPLCQSLSNSDDESTLDEMGAAIAAAPSARHVGIDGINGRFVRELLGSIRAGESSLKSIGRLVRESFGFSRTALHCRTASLFSRTDLLGAGRFDSHDYDCEPTDSPTVQAEHEREHVARCRAFASAFGASDAVRLRDEIRERCMTARIDDLRRDGDVVAVIGVAHLESVARRLASH